MSSAASSANGHDISQQVVSLQIRFDAHEKRCDARAEETSAALHEFRGVMRDVQGDVKQLLLNDANRRGRDEENKWLRGEARAHEASRSAVAARRVTLMSAAIGAGVGFATQFLGGVLRKIGWIA
jgi:hypothetical protein